ncbi:MAG TPA: cytochrome c [Bryobacteraceae bacterium]|nr:cytochrome c [Bryobacteraceae bacterium]
MAGAVALQAHEPITTKLTWTQEISRIVYKRCVSCHHQGGASFSLVNYDDARPWAKAIRDEVLGRRMPPWGAVGGIRAYRDDPSLTPLEMEMIVNWVEGGAPEGEPIYMPPAPRFESDANAEPPAAARSTITVESAKPLTLAQPITAAAIRPQDLSTGASMEVTAYKPDGTVEHLVWLRRYREEWARTYEFRDPIPLPRGTRIVVDSTVPAAAVISLAR